MCRRSSWAMISVTVVTACLVSCLCFSALGDPPAPAPPPAPAAPVAKQPVNPAPGSTPLGEQSYVGIGGCFVCHQPQAKAWSATKHSHEFTGLPAPYRNDGACLKCHVTAYGSATGYVVGMPAKSAPDFAVVGCEMCHGPGARHKQAAERFANAANPADEAKFQKETVATIRKTPPDSVCAACHTAQTHRGHPWYEGQPLPQSAACATVFSGAGWPGPCGCYPPRGTDVKACAACHYRQYKTWLTGKHSALSANMLPAKYVNDPKCLKCHTTASAPGGLATSKIASVKPDRLGVGCESCHGGGRQHVAFNMQFIAYPPLGPALEQAARQRIRSGKPFDACTECHIGQTHQEHPKYDKS